MQGMDRRSKRRRLGGCRRRRSSSICISSHNAQINVLLIDRGVFVLFLGVYGLGTALYTTFLVLSGFFFFSFVYWYFGAGTFGAFLRKGYFFPVTSVFFFLFLLCVY